ncbi:nucleoside diphosphate-linked moiety X motif 17 [Discoglossus pictus]
MEPAKRVLVYLRREGSLLHCAKFVQDVTGHFSSPQEDRVYVTCRLDQNRFVISDRTSSGSSRVQLQRPSLCPIKNLSPAQAASLPEDVQGRGVDVGVAVLVQSVNKRVLLTRRSRSLNIFPNVWVPPGGHVEPGEQLLQAGLRELQEETGIQLQEGSVSWSMLGLWEVGVASSAGRPIPVPTTPVSPYTLPLSLIYIRAEKTNMHNIPEYISMRVITDPPSCNKEIWCWVIIVQTSQRWATLCRTSEKKKQNLDKCVLLFVMRQHIPYDLSPVQCCLTTYRMEPAKRVLVYLRREGSLLHCAKFVQDVTGHFSSPQEDRVYVTCRLDQNRFMISDRTSSGSSRVQLQRPSFCPIKNLSPAQAASLPEDVQGRGVDVGVAVLVQSVNKRVLLTRRSRSLNIFPNVWVPPGGHVEPGEQLLQAGLRELQEETGIQLQEGSVSWSMLGLWESVFPPMLCRGLPRRHHIVTFLLVQSGETHQELQDRLRPDEREVSACAWLDPEIARRIAEDQDEAKDAWKDLSSLPPTIRVMEVSSGCLTQTDQDTTIFFNTVFAEGEDVERVSSGTKYALGLWLETLGRASPLAHTNT